MTNFTRASHGTAGVEGYMKLRHQRPRRENRRDWYKLPGGKKEKRHQHAREKKRSSSDVMPYRVWTGGVQRDGRICEWQSQRWFLEQWSGQTKRDQRGDWTEDLGSKQRAAVGDAGTRISRKRFHLKSAVFSVSVPLQWLKRNNQCPVKTSSTVFWEGETTSLRTKHNHNSLEFVAVSSLLWIRHDCGPLGEAVDPQPCVILKSKRQTGLQVLYKVMHTVGRHIPGC